MLVWTRPLKLKREFKIENAILTHADIPMLRRQFHCTFQTLKRKRKKNSKRVE